MSVHRPREPVMPAFFSRRPDLRVGARPLPGNASGRRSRTVRLLAVTLPLVALATWQIAEAQAQLTPATSGRSAAAAPAPCETCGTVVAISRVLVEGVTPPLAAVPQRVLERATADGTTVSAAPEGGPRQRYEILIRLSAGTQQVVMLDDRPKVVVGQRVRISDGAVLPDRG